MQEALRRASKVARFDSTVLIVGENRSHVYAEVISQPRASSVAFNRTAFAISVSRPRQFEQDRFAAEFETRRVAVRRSITGACEIVWLRRADARPLPDGASLNPDVGFCRNRSRSDFRMKRLHRRIRR
jgi:hypothetical protein